MIYNILIYIKKFIYEFPQSGKLSHNKIPKIITNNCFHSSPISPGLWKHASILHSLHRLLHNIIQHNFRLNLLRPYYEMRIDYTGNNLCGITIQWNGAMKTGANF